MQLYKGDVFQLNRFTQIVRKRRADILGTEGARRKGGRAGIGSDVDLFWLSYNYMIYMYDFMTAITTQSKILQWK